LQTVADICCIIPCCKPKQWW